MDTKRTEHRRVAIDTPPERTRPWLVHTGWHRGHWYTAWWVTDGPRLRQVRGSAARWWQRRNGRCALPRRGFLPSGDVR